MPLQGSLGTQLWVSPVLPTTHDAAGITGIDADKVKVGRLSTVPDLNGVRDVATFDDLELGEEVKFADILRAGGGEATVGLDDDNTGQQAIETAHASGDKVIIGVVLKNGAEYWRKCIITAATPSGIAPGGVVMLTVGFEFESTTIKIPAP